MDYAASAASNGSQVMIPDTKDFNWWSNPHSGQVTQIPEKMKNQMWDKLLYAACSPKTDQHGHCSQGLMCPHETAALTLGLSVTNSHVQLQHAHALPSCWGRDLCYLLCTGLGKIPPLSTLFCEAAGDRGELLLKASGW